MTNNSIRQHDGLKLECVYFLITIIGLTLPKCEMADLSDSTVNEAKNGMGWSTLIINGISITNTTKEAENRMC